MAITPHDVATSPHYIGASHHIVISKHWQALHSVEHQNKPYLRVTLSRDYSLSGCKHDQFDFGSFFLT